MEAVLEWTWLIAVVLTFVGGGAWRWYLNRSIAKTVEDMERN